MLWKRKNLVYSADELATLQFTDEQTFRERVADYFEFVLRVTAIASETDAWFYYDDEEIREVAITNNTAGSRFETLIRHPHNALSEWQDIEFESPAEGVSWVDSISIRKSVRNNQKLLLQIMRYADDPKLIEKRRRAERERRGNFSRRVFIVHGHDEQAKEDVAECLKSLEMTPVILHLQPNQGKTIIEKFETESDVGFAVVLMTPDDRGAVASDDHSKTLKFRPRQNVVLELGYFVAKLGRSRVATLRKGDIELPSDILGVVYTDMDSHGRWKLDLAKELSAAGYQIDFSKIK